MCIRHHKPEEIVTKLRQVDVLIKQGMSRPLVHDINTTCDRYFLRQVGHFSKPRLQTVYSWINITRLFAEGL